MNTSSGVLVNIMKSEKRNFCLSSKSRKINFLHNNNYEYLPLFDFSMPSLLLLFVLILDMLLDNLLLACHSLPS